MTATSSREKVITVRLSLAEHRRFEKTAKKMKLSVSGMLRLLVTEADLRLRKGGH